MRARMRFRSVRPCVEVYPKVRLAQLFSYIANVEIILKQFEVAQVDRHRGRNT
jgi:hypothetical protein